MGNITIKDIAKQCGVGVSTVSRALNNHSEINEATRQKILKVVEENNYVPNNSARNLKKTNANTIAVLVKNIENPFFSKMIKVYESKIIEKGYEMYLQHVSVERDEIDVAIEISIEKKIKGIIFLGGHFERSEAELCKLKIPFVVSTVYSQNPLPENILGCYVSVDDYKESFRIVDFLCQLGHRKIAMIGSYEGDSGIGKLRLEGYKAALKKNNIKYNQDYMLVSKNNFDTISMKTGYEMAQKLLDKKLDVTAIFAISDIVAIGVAKAIFDYGLNIPNDFSLVGFDGLDQTLFYEPSITTIQQPLKEIAIQSVDSLFQMIETEKKVENIIIDGVLLNRKSSKTK